MQDEYNVAAKITPAIGGFGLSAWTLNEWVAAATLLYVLAQTGLLVPKYVAIWRGRKARRKGGEG